jgi:hypothetical protein
VWQRGMNYVVRLYEFSADMPADEGTTSPRSCAGRRPFPFLSTSPKALGAPAQRSLHGSSDMHIAR